jgi:heat shock protein HslJ
MFAEANAMDVSLLEGRWVLETVNGKGMSGEQEIYFEIKGETITGYDGCNRFGGSLAQPSQLRKSQRGCSSEEPQFPLDLSNPLAQLSVATLQGNQLILRLPDGKGEAKFKRS